MKRPILRWPARDSHGADTWAVIFTAGGIFWLLGWNYYSPAVAPWMGAYAALSITAGSLLWLRVKGAAWVAVAVFLTASGIFIRNLIFNGWSLYDLMGALLPLAAIFWLLCIDGAQFANDRDD